MSKSIKLKNEIYWDATSVKQKTVDFNSDWLPFTNINGMGWTFVLPCFNPKRITPTLNITALSYFRASWYDIPIESLKVRQYRHNYIVLWVDTTLSNVPSTVDNVLIRLTGTISFV